ncbi:hypothetical protein LSAT2_015810 [Lamellibrachia satsuma]|nr:hypothetical protein LSAT2_015810 [Lamellibrachia satsuma]
MLQLALLRASTGLNNWVFISVVTIFCLMSAGYVQCTFLYDCNYKRFCTMTARTDSDFYWNLWVGSHMEARPLQHRRPGSKTYLQTPSLHYKGVVCVNSNTTRSTTETPLSCFRQYAANTTQSTLLPTDPN